MATLRKKQNGASSSKNKRLPSTPNEGDIVLLTQSRVGVVRYIGTVDGKSQSIHDHYIGIEIRITDGAVGDNDGTYNNKKYFKCPNNCGLFIAPQQILQVYTPEDLLEMIIQLKDKLLPLMSSTSPQSSIKKKPPKLKINNKDKQTTKSWPSATSMQYIKEDEDIYPINTQNKQQWNIKIDSPHLSKRNNISSNINNFNLTIATTHQMKKSAQSTFDDVDMNIAAPLGLMKYFANSPAKSGQISPGLGAFSLSPSPSPVGKKHTKGVSSRLSLYRAHSTQASDVNGSMWASYQKLKLLHRCVTLRKKAGKQSIVLDLAHFGLYLKKQNINEKHKWYESIWNKYDKLFTLKIDFYFVNELLTDLLNEYLLNEYQISTDNIMMFDIKKAIQQIIFHIRPYHIELHQSPFDINIMDEDAEIADDDEMPFTFNDLCVLGVWLSDIEELEEGDEFEEDYFTMDIHYFDFVQYINSHKLHIWKKVVHKAIKSKKKKYILDKFNVNKIKYVIKEMLMDYGRNGLGNVNMEIYQGQIKEYTNHLSKLFNEYIQSEMQNRNYITKEQFFEFVACIPSL